MTSILLVEDDTTLAALVRDFLGSHGFTVSVEGRGDRAVDAVQVARPDLVLLDLMLPGLDGLEVCRRLRSAGFAGAILMLTARGEDLDEILGLQGGADDYLTKPVRPRVLLARVQAALRRLQPREATITRGRLLLDLARRAATLDGEDLALTTAEFELLVVLARRAGEVLSRDDLSLELRGVAWDGLDRSIDLRVSRLRKRLGDEQGVWIKSVRGSGYLLVPAL
jgi:DNA-binding response OmpR family regulator